ncbi:MAG: ComEA family DNA-binding protein [Firmicutes bacterium]|nr:ComEA family DNA-binding protein [Bacillota bacterium]
MREIIERIKCFIESNETLRRIRDEYGGQIKKICFVAVLVIVCLLAFAVKNDGADEAVADEGVNIEEETQEETKGSIYVDIGGAVKNPMLAELPEGSRVEDAIKAAGGITENADMTGINRAAFAEDGSKIFIPDKIEISDSEVSETQTTAGYTGGSGTGKININTADSGQLQELNGVGPATAQKIIDYRTQNGSFTSIEDIKNVSGIGDKTFEKLRDSITI